MAVYSTVSTIQSLGVKLRVGEKNLIKNAIFNVREYIWVFTVDGRKFH